jgi:hypothetical protein
VVGEGIDYGYSTFLSFSDLDDAGTTAGWSTFYGGAGDPWSAKDAFYKSAPDLNANLLRTPLRMEFDAGGHSVVEIWPLYAAFRYNNPAVEAWEFPAGRHNLVRPHDMLVSQTGAADWLEFWLTGKEENDPGNKEQYARWREMRRLWLNKFSDSPNAPTAEHQ